MSRLPLALFVLLLAAPALAAEAEAEAEPQGPPPGVLLDRVVANVNDGIVTQSEVDERLAQAINDLRRSNTNPGSVETLRRAVLDRLIIEELQSQRAERVGIEVSDDDLQRELRRLAEANSITLDQLPAALAREGINYASFRENMRGEIGRQLLRRREVFNRAMASITPREVEQYMERLKKLPDERAEYNWSHILIAVPSDANQQQVDAAAERARDVHKRAATEDFAQLAVAFSNSQKALEGGLMGWVRGAELPSFLAESIVVLKPGEVAPPLQQANGFHIVKLNAVRSGDGDTNQQQTHARHILMTTNALQDDATVRQRLAGIRERVLAGEDFGAFASTLSEDKGSAVDGGDLGWFPAGQMVAEFDAALADLKDGEISAPFRTEHGWHIAQVLGRRQFDVTEDMLRQRAFQQLGDSKAEQELDLWLRRLRDEAFVETDVD